MELGEDSTIQSLASSSLIWNTRMVKKLAFQCHNEDLLWKSLIEVLERPHLKAAMSPGKELKMLQHLLLTLLQGQGLH